MKDRYIFNTGRYYGPKGQVIVLDVWNKAEGVYMMNDVSRGICHLYQLYDYQYDAERARNWPDQGWALIKYELMRSYDNNAAEWNTRDYERFYALRGTAPALDTFPDVDQDTDYSGPIS